MNYIKVNYTHSFNDEGCYYSQKIYLTKELVNQFNEFIKTQTPNSYEIMYLEPLSDKKTQCLKLTQLKYLVKMLNQLDYNTKRILDRNTLIVVCDKSPKSTNELITERLNKKHKKNKDELERVRKIIRTYAYECQNGISFHLDDYDADRQSDYEFIKKFIGW